MKTPQQNRHKKWFLFALSGEMSPSFSFVSRVEQGNSRNANEINLWQEPKIRKPWYQF